MPTPAVHAFTDELAQLDAVATAEAIRSGELSATEVVTAAVTRAERIASSINAIVTPDFERAVRTAAKTAPGAFAGVPTFIKDPIDVEGLPTRHGSEALDGVGQHSTRRASHNKCSTWASSVRGKRQPLKKAHSP